MKMASLGVSIVLASLLLAVQPVAAAEAPVTISLTVIGGGGELSNSSTFGVQFLSLGLTNPARTVNIQRGNLVLDGVRTSCSAISNVLSCSEATLTCANGTHDVVAGVPGVSLGSIDGVEVADGFIHMTCFSR